MSETPRVGIRFGAMSDPIQKQLKAQGLKAPPRAIREWQKRADEITSLYVHGFLSPGMATTARTRLFKLIGKVAHD